MEMESVVMPERAAELLHSDRRSMEGTFEPLSTAISLRLYKSILLELE